VACGGIANPSVHRLLYQKIPVKVASEWGTGEVGNQQVDYMAHSGRRRSDRGALPGSDSGRAGSHPRAAAFSDSRSPSGQRLAADGYDRRVADSARGKCKCYAARTSSSPP
jgi:hypothetical protein